VLSEGSNPFLKHVLSAVPALVAKRFLAIVWESPFVSAIESNN